MGNPAGHARRCRTGEVNELNSGSLVDRLCIPYISSHWLLSVQLLIPCVARDIALAEMYVADLLFTTGTIGERTPVRMIDGRTIKNQHGSTVFEQLLQTFRAHTQEAGYLFE